MKKKKANIKRVRIVTLVLVAGVVSVGVVRNNFILALVGVVVGMLFLVMVRRRMKVVLVDEKTEKVCDKAGRAAFGVAAAVLGVSSVVLVFVGRQGEPYLEALGTLVSYLVLFMLLVYGVFYYYFKKRI
jgi:uncharacterized membrane protein